MAGVRDVIHGDGVAIGRSTGGDFGGVIDGLILAVHCHAGFHHPILQRVQRFAFRFPLGQVGDGGCGIGIADDKGRYARHILPDIRGSPRFLQGEGGAPGLRRFIRPGLGYRNVHQIVGQGGGQLIAVPDGILRYFDVRIGAAGGNDGRSAFLHAVGVGHIVGSGGHTHAAHGLRGGQRHALLALQALDPFAGGEVGRRQRFIGVVGAVHSQVIHRARHGSSAAAKGGIGGNLLHGVIDHRAGGPSSFRRAVPGPGFLHQQLGALGVGDGGGIAGNGGNGIIGPAVHGIGGHAVFRGHGGGCAVVLHRRLRHGIGDFVIAAVLQGQLIPGGAGSAAGQGDGVGDQGAAPESQIRRSDRRCNAVHRLVQGGFHRHARRPGSGAVRVVPDLGHGGGGFRGLHLRVHHQDGAGLDAIVIFIGKDKPGKGFFVHGFGNVSDRPERFLIGLILIRHGHVPGVSVRQLEGRRRDRNLLVIRQFFDGVECNVRRTPGFFVIRAECNFQVA